MFVGLPWSAFGLPWGALECQLQFFRMPVERWSALASTYLSLECLGVHVQCLALLVGVFSNAFGMAGSALECIHNYPCLECMGSASNCLFDCLRMPLEWLGVHWSAASVLRRQAACVGSPTPSCMRRLSDVKFQARSFPRLSLRACIHVSIVCGHKSS